MKKIMLKDGDKVIHNNRKYEYCEFYERLEAEDIENNFAVLCPVCMSSMFSISYKEYECVANCVCGHSFTIYDG